MPVAPFGFMSSSAGVPFVLDFTSQTFDYTLANFSRFGARRRVRSNGSWEMLSNSPRFDYNPATNAYRGLLIEPAATQLLGDSHFSTNTSMWGPANTTIVQSGTGPDYMPSWKLAAAATTTANTYIWQSPANQFGAVSGQTYTGTTIAKAAEYNFLRKELFDGTAFRPVYYNLANGTVASQSSGVTGSIDDLGGGWYGCNITRTLGATSMAFMVSPSPTDRGAGSSWSESVTAGSGILVHSSQLTLGSTPSSWIQTGSYLSQRFYLTVGADTLTFTIPAGGSQIVYTFDDDSTQTVAVSPGAYTVPTNLNRRWVKRIAGNWSVTPAILPASYVGNIGTRVRIPDSSSAGSYKQANSRTLHVLHEDVTSLTILWSPFRADGTTSTDVAGTGVVTLTASVEYPVGSGSFTQVLFSGAVSGALSGSTVLAGVATFTAPKGAQIAIRSFADATVAFLYTGVPQYVSPYSIDLCEAAASGLTDKTMGGTITQTAAQPPIFPCAIVASTWRPTFFAVGDSNAIGKFQDSTAGDFGVIEPWLDEQFGVLNIGAASEQAQNFVGGALFRKPLAAYCSNLVTNFGINDLVLGGRTDAQLQTSLTQIAALWPTKPAYLVTLTPYTTSTDSFNTTANQTVTAYEPDRLANNIWRVGIPATFTGCFDVNTAVSVSGKWAPAPIASVTQTPDGLHTWYAGHWYLRQFTAFIYSTITR